MIIIKKYYIIYIESKKKQFYQKDKTANKD
nr:MAG TPA: hypothetical protein [Caudoviricetes sp.]